MKKEKTATTKKGSSEIVKGPGSEIKDVKDLEAAGKKKKPDIVMEKPKEVTAALEKVREDNASKIYLERQKVFGHFKDIIRQKFQKEVSISQMAKDIGPELAKISSLTPIFVVYYTLNKLGLRKTAVEQRILSREMEIEDSKR